MKFKPKGKFNSRKLNKIKRIWKEKESKILRCLNRLTGIKVKTNKITCKINPKDSNGYYGMKNITAGVYNNPQATLQVITHELIHIVYWKRIKELKLTRSILGKEKEWEWKLSEFSVYLLQKEPEMMKFWPNEKIPLYPKIKNFNKLAKKFWKGNFDDYLIKSYALLRKKYK